MQSKVKLKLKDVENTLLIPLWSRAKETDLIGIILTCQML